MANWNKIMDAYESNDCESLGGYAAEHLNEICHYLTQYYSDEDAYYYTFLCALYFVDVDEFVDGGEEDVLRYAMADWNYQYNYSLLRRNFHENRWSYTVERIMNDAPRHIREVFARLGCAICSGKGYISDAERRVILKWV